MLLSTRISNTFQWRDLFRKEICFNFFQQREYLCNWSHVRDLFCEKNSVFPFETKWQSKANILAQKVTFKQLVRLLSIIISLFSVRE